jgi:hypothetical protein
MRSALLYAKIDERVGRKTDGVLGNVTGRSAKTDGFDCQTESNGWKRNELDDPGCSRSNRAKSMDMRHDIVPALLLLFRSNVKLFRSKVLHDVKQTMFSHTAASDGRAEGRTRLSFICAIASSEICNPSSFSAMARLSQSFLQVWNRICLRLQLAQDQDGARYKRTAGEKRCAISLLAYRLRAYMSERVVYCRNRI